MDLRLRTREEQGKVVLVLPVFFTILHCFQLAVTSFNLPQDDCVLPMRLIDPCLYFDPGAFPPHFLLFC